MSEVREIRTVLVPEFALRQPARLLPLRTVCMILPPAFVVSDFQDLEFGQGRLISLYKSL